MKKKLLSKKTLSIVLAMLMILSLLPIGVLADTWEVKQSGPSDPIYYYGGETKSPDESLKENPLNFLAVPDPAEPAGTGNTVKALLHQYKLLDTVSKQEFYVYCSDYDVQAMPNNYYFRTPIEKSDLGLSYNQSERLRAIMLNSDLWLTIDTIRGLTGISGLTAGEALAAVQYTIWKLINGDTLNVSSSGASALQNDNVKKYSNWLMNLPGVKAEDVAWIEIQEPIRKAREPNTENLYSATIYYEISGPGVVDLDAEVKVEASYSNPGGSPQTVLKDNIETDDGVVVIHNVPTSAKLTVTLTSAQNNVKDIFLYQAKNGVSNSQTFVGVAATDVPLETEVLIDGPGELFPLTIFKDWKNESNVTISNNAVKEYTAQFRFTYADGPYVGQKVIAAEPTIYGNGSFTSGYIFEIDKLYKIEEIDAKADGKSVESTAAAKYFKFDANGNTIWTNEDGTSVSGSNRFANTIKLKTGSVAVTKTVTNAEFMPGDKDELFKFEIKSGGAALANEAFDIYVGATKVDGETGMTDENGIFYLEQGQTALFQGLPVGSAIVVNELDNNGNASRYTFNTATGSCTVAENTKHEINISNTLKLGSLTINKTFTGEIGWGSFPSGHKITFTVKYPGGAVEEHTLTAGTPKIELTNIPIGDYTITEKTEGDNSAAVAGYVLTSDTEKETTVGVGGNASVSFTNEYRKELADLTLKKSLVLGSTLTTDQKAALGNLTFVFTITGDNGFTKTVEIKNGDEETITLVPGTYTITETVLEDATVLGEVNNTITVPGKTVSGNSFTVTMEDEKNQSLTVTNTYAKKAGKLTITKALSGVDKGQFAAEAFTFTVTGPNSFSETVKLPKANGSMSHTIENLAPGEYIVTETGYGRPDDYTFVGTAYATTSGTGGDENAKATVTENNTNTVTVTNTYTRLIGDVAFKKTVVGLDVGDEFSFTVDVKDGSSAATGSYDYFLNGSETKTGTITLSSGKATISGIKHNDTVVIKGLPSGTTVTITEIANSYYSTSPASHTYTVGTDTGTKIFTNTRKTVDFTLKKVLEGAAWSDFYESGNSSKTGIQFEITGPAGWSTVEDVDIPVTLTSVNGSTSTFTFWVTSSTELEFENLPAGEYTITEIVSTAGRSGYGRETTIKVDGITSGTEYAVVLAGVDNPYASAKLYHSNGKFTFTNKYGREGGTLSITKNVVNDTKGRWFKIDVTFSPELSAAEGAALTATYSSGAGAVVSADGYKPAYDATTKTFTFYITDAGIYHLKNIPTGVVCTVTETAVIPTGGGDNIISQYTVTYPNGQTATVSKDVINDVYINNLRYTDTSVTVTKNVAEGDPDRATASFTFTITVDGVVWANKGHSLGTTSPTGTFTLKNGETATFEDIPRGAVVVITEANNSNYTTSYTVSGAGVGDTTTVSGRAATFTTENAAEAEAEVTFTNTRGTGSLDVKKLVAGDAEAIAAMSGTAYTFTLKRGTTAIGEETFAIANGKDGRDSDETGADGTFTLYAGEIAKFTNLPAGSYTVTESSVTPTNGIGWAKSGDGAVTVSSGGTITKTVTNTFTYKTGTLTVKKTAAADGVPSWETSPATGSFNFTLKDSGGNAVTSGFSIKIGSSTTTNNTGTFSLKHNETATITGLKYGSYYVEESNTAPEGYELTTTYNGEDSAEDAMQTVDAADKLIEVKNEFTRGHGDLSVKKMVTVDNEGAFPGEPNEKGFTFTLYARANKTNIVTGYNYSIDGGESLISSNGTFVLEHNQTATITDLPSGTYYVVEDTVKAAVDGYELVVTGGGTVSGATDGETLTVTNDYTRETGALTVSKTVTQNAHAPDSWTFNFTITGPDDWNGSYTGGELTETESGSGIYTLTLTSGAESSITLEGLPGGKYTVTELETGATTVANCRMDTKANNAVSKTAEASVGGEAKEAAFVNTYNLIGAFLTLTKDYDGASFPEGTIIFDLEVSSGGTYEDYDNLTIPVEGSWKVSKELPEGLYRIKENSETAVINGYTFMGVSYTDGTQSLADKVDEDGWLYFEIRDTANIAVTATNHYMRDGGILTVTKEMDTDSGYAGGDEFVFLIEQDGSPLGNYKYYVDGTPRYTTKDGDVGRFSLLEGETAEFRELDIGKTFTVTEVGAFKSGVDHTEYYELSDVSGKSFTFTVSPDGIARTEGGGLEVTRIGDLENSVNLSFEAQDEGRFPGAALTFTNKRLLGELTVRKILDDNLSKALFTMQISFTYNGSPINLSEIGTITVGGGKFDTTGLGGVLEVSVPANGSVTIGGLPRGISYRVNETYNEAYEATYDGQEGTIGAEESLCVVNNELQYGKLLVTKYVKGISTTETFSISVTLTPAAGVEFTENTVANLGVSTGFISSGLEGKNIVIQLALNGSSQISNIPLGTSYVVSEDLSGKPEYQKMIFGGEGIIHAYEEGKTERNDCLATIYNFYIPENSLLIAKDVDATPGSPMNTQRFSFTLKFFKPGEETGEYEREIRNQLEIVENLLGATIGPLAEQAENWLLENPWTDDDATALADAETTYLNAMADAAELRNGCIDCGSSGVVPHEENCPTCDGTGEVSVPVECPCGGEDEDCPTCRGTGSYSEPDTCENCNGAMTVVNGTEPCPTCSETVAQAEADAKKAFDEDPAVIKDAETKAKKKDVENKKKLEAIKDTLFIAGKYVEWDENYDVIDLGDDVAFEFESREELEAMITVHRGEELLSLSDINFQYDDVTGEITFTLASGEILQIDGLPEGIVYEITESNYTGVDAHAGTTINGIEGTTTRKTLTKDGNAHSVMFLNKYTRATGSLTVVKSWPNGIGADYVTVQLYKGNEAFGDPVRLDAGNDWKHTFTDLPLDGSVYSVSETDAPAGYLVSYSFEGIELTYESRAGAITVTNSWIPPWTPPETPETPEEPEPPVDIEEPGDPLAPAEPEEPEEPEEPPIEIYDPEDPLGDAPKTGDSTPLAALWAVFGASAIGLIVLLIPRKKKQGDIPA